MTNEQWRAWVDSLDAHEREIVQTVVVRVLYVVGPHIRRTEGQGERVTEAHLRLDQHAERIGATEDAIDAIGLALLQLSLDFGMLRERQAGDGGG